ncbi:MAG: DedA family protein [Casimicrobiaceae bacterium]
MLTSVLYSIFSLDSSLPAIVTQYGNWVYAILFLIIFAETGLVIFPFLPGDSILFIAGATSAASTLNVHVLVIVLVAAAILGDSTNFAVGRFVGPKVFSHAGQHGIWRFVKKSHLEQTHDFFERYGAFTIIIGRFVPIVRTFAPFLAGVGEMTYAKFLSYNIIGGIIWITLLLYAGHFFGNIPWVKDHFHWVVLGIIVVSLLPMVIEFAKAKLRASK